MMIVRNYEEKDIEAIQNINFMLGLEIQWHDDFDKANAFVAIDGDTVVGVGTLCYGNSWSYMELEVEHDLRLDLNVDISRPNQDEIMSELIKECVVRLDDYKKNYPKSKLTIRYWTESSNLHTMQLFLQQGFIMRRLSPVLKYDLSHDIKHYAIPKNIKIEQLTLDEKNINEYIEATGKANQGVCDSKAPIYFRMNAANFKIYVAKDKDTIVSAVTLWDDPDGGSATEDIFTIPKYRRMNIARETIATGLEDLKKRNRTMATLSLVGENESAMRLYQSTGYELFYLLIELNYCI